MAVPGRSGLHSDLPGPRHAALTEVPQPYAEGSAPVEVVQVTTYAGHAAPTAAPRVSAWSSERGKAAE